jgi:hypothetical protein
LAALGERDAEVAARNPEPFSAEQCSIARRQARDVWIRSLVVGVVVTVVIWMLLDTPML